MPDASGLQSTVPSEIGQALHDFMTALFPLFRSITGAGLRQTLAQIGQRIPLNLVEVPSGQPVLGWQVPQEWNLRAARLETLDGRIIADISQSNLHLVHYSEAVDRVVPLEELRAHLHSLPEHPDWIPYRTSYYAPGWGFCLADRVLRGLTDPAYRVLIDADLSQGALSYGETVCPGTSDDEFLLSIHICHPSLANDNLAGIAVATALAERLARRPHRLTYRLLFIPGTIGSLAWLAQPERRLDRIRYGLVLSCLGDPAAMTYKQSRRGDAAIDRIAAHVMARNGGRVQPFIPWGYDERQYCSPGFNLPVGCLMRSPNGSYPEYHTSADNLDYVTPAALADSLARLEEIIEIAEQDARYQNLAPYGEPQLGRYGLYRATGGLGAAGDQGGRAYDTLALLWVLNQSDGNHSLFDIAEISGKPFSEIRAAATALVAAGLLGAA